MPGQNLTRIEAQTRAQTISTKSYLIELDLDPKADLFRSKTTVRFSCKTPGAASFIDAITAKVHSIELNGVTLSSSLADGSRISLPNLELENELVVDADYYFMNTGEGLHKFVDPVDGEAYLYTQFEVPDSRRMFAVFEQPNLKAEFTFSVKAPSSWKVVSNQPLEEKVEIGDERAEFRFKATPRISSYITALIAGPYVETRDTLTSSDGREIPLGVFCRASLAEYMDADYVFEKTKQGFKFFENAFKFPYPFEKYDQLFVPEFNAGAMENAGAVTFTETYVFRSKVSDAVRERRVVTILHELAHMWFGDLVTMNWWNDLWLNESFAEYASTLATAEATEWHGAWTTFAALEKSWAYRQDQLPSTHPIVAEIRDLEDVLVNFDGITYAKGASVLKQLVAWVGQDAFLAGVANYFKKHAWKNTELSDLMVELEKTSARDLTEWSKLWLETAGVNTLRSKITDANGVIEKFEILQSAPADYPTLRPHRMAIGCYNLVSERLVRTARFEIDVAGPVTEVRELAGANLPDLILLNDDDLAYAKIRLDDRSLQTAINHLSKFDDSLARSLVLGAVWDSTRDAETPVADFISLVLKNIASETESTTVLTLLRQLVTATRTFSAKKNRTRYIEQTADALFNLATTAEPGSDTQFQFIKFFANFASTESQLDKLESLLGGELTLEKLVVDTDLRWEFITGLVAAGRFDQRHISAALEKDNTSNGQRAAIAAEAAIPSADAKAAMWKRLTTDKSLSNVMVNAGSLGFVRANDQTLLEPFIDKYFEAVLPIWQSNTFKIAEYLLENLYPIELASSALAQRTAEKIAQPEIAAIPALKRILVENLANVERALKASALDARS